MAILSDILRGWRDPGGLFQAKRGQGEGAALATLMGACALIFVAQWPRLAREAHLHPEVPLDARLGGALMGIVFVLPLILYAVAGLSQIAFRAFGRRVEGLDARVALFWALLCLTPALFLHGLATGFIGQSAAVMLLGLLVLAGFGYLWLSMLARVGK
ncbi:MAG: YIP1 family protein [Paracoccaceae bacterium]